MTQPSFDAAVRTLEALVAARGDDSPALVDAFVVTREAADPPYIVKALLDGALTDEFRQATADKAQNFAGLTPRPYGPAAELSGGEVMFTDATVGLLATIESHVATGDADLYDPSADYNDHLRLMVTKVTLDDGRAVTFYRELRPTAYLGRSRTFAGFWSEGRFNKVVDENVLLFDRRFDAVVTDEVALFKSKNVFERIFDFLIELQNSAAATFTAITSGLRIDGLAEMEAACTTNMAMMSKMASIQRRINSDPAYQATMTMDRLVAFAVAHPETEIDLVGAGTTARLRWVPAPAKRFKILRLLDDDYLSSFLTARLYEANSKSDPL